MNLCQQADNIKGKFQQFADNPENMVCDLPLLIKGASHYIQLLYIQVNAILAGIDGDIKVWQYNIDVWEKIAFFSQPKDEQDNFMLTDRIREEIKEEEAEYEEETVAEQLLSVLKDSKHS